MKFNIKLIKKFIEKTYIKAKPLYKRDYNGEVIKQLNLLNIVVGVVKPDGNMEYDIIVKSYKDDFPYIFKYCKYVAFTKHCFNNFYILDNKQYEFLFINTNEQIDKLVSILLNSGIDHFEIFYNYKLIIDKDTDLLI